MDYSGVLIFSSVHFKKFHSSCCIPGSYTVCIKILVSTVKINRNRMSRKLL